MDDVAADLSSFFDMSIDMMCVAGTDGYFKQINPAFKRTLGYTKEELLQRPFVDFIHPDDVAATLAEVEKLASGAPTLYFENRYRCQDGSFKWLAWTAYPVGAALYAIARDITEQKQLYAELEEREGMFRTLFNTASIATVLVNEKGVIVMINEMARSMFGYDDDDIIGAPVECLLPAELAAVHEAHRRHYQKRPHVRAMGISMELQGRRQDGSLFPVEIGLSYFKARHETIILAFIVDITDRKRNEQEREKLVEELKAFAHTVAHDLKNPLGLIAGYADLLRLPHGGASSVDLDEGLEIIERTSRKMSNIVNELLMLASVRDIDEIDVQAMDMAAVFDEARERLAPMIADTNATIVLPERWPVCLGYAPWLEEVWVNYISNALKYGGEPPQLEIGATIGNDMVRYWLRDNGPGIDAAHTSRLFTQFTRLDRKRAEGHGLGLSIVRRIVEKLGGEVGVESAPGAGSTFFFTLPRAW